MATFDFLENFFFISLAITFGLILMLVYHFKSRIVAVEKNIDRTNEALTGVLKMCRSLIEQQSNVHLANTPLPSSYKQTIDIPIVSSTGENSIQPEDRIMYQLREVDDEATEYEEDSEDTFSDDDENTDQVTVDEAQMDSVSEDDTHSIDETDDDVMDEVKVYHVSSSPKLQLSEPSSHNVMEEITVETDKIATTEELTEVEEVKEEEIPKDNIEPTIDLGNITTSSEPILAPVDDTISDISTVFDKNAKEVYRKMSIGQLRTIAISAGITVDTTKMKKNDLIKLLLQL